ncbi:YheT family hydrolase [Piscirickettsia litoralis]|uniref:Alpha/beta hydrolase n=1 Tax=Piscirickettsia litoralis TaxID=1891921 RepID=A0ABX3A2R7_9GAMM|nr:alpha/beta fold hydrolase [Piscirickettsia litoralis]ODN43157.1 alpha/beta hydrolase [Piscirickettsia litoralis]
MTYPPFKAHWSIKNPHLQTILASLRKPNSTLKLSHEYVDIPGDQLELVWLNQHLIHTQPILLLIHGLEGSAHSAYIQALMHQAHHYHFSMVTLHFRGCDGRVNQLAEGYHAGQSQDIATVIDHLRQYYPNCPLFAAGFSLGANALLKYLGENSLNPLQGAAAVSTPFNLSSACAQLEKPANKLYQYSFLKSLKRTVQNKIDHGVDLSISKKRLQQLKTVRQIDEEVTAPTHGFNSAEHYYQSCSSQNFIADIKTPTLIIHAKDDPIIPASCIPAQFPSSCQAEIYDHGGHVGFLGQGRYLPQSWLEKRLLHWFQYLLK